MQLCRDRADVKTGKLEELLGPNDVGLPNGMAWDTARRKMYFVDTYAGTILTDSAANTAICVACQTLSNPAHRIGNSAFCSYMCSHLDSFDSLSRMEPSDSMSAFLLLVYLLDDFSRVALRDLWCMPRSF